MQLKFTLQGQRLIRTDKLRPVADSKNFLGAEFGFSHQWGGCEKTAIFKASDGTAYSVLLNEDKCSVPYEVTGADFYVSVFGVKDEMRITSDEATVSVEASGYTEGETPQEPTQTVYEQILNRVAESEAAISEEVTAHSQNLENPHSVTKEQIGLGNVDNTADLDKPVSSAVQAALDLKADKQELSESISVVETDMNGIADELRKDIDSHNTAAEMHISSDERALWNTVSDKAEQSDLEDLQAQADNNSDNIIDLQTQIGDIETVLADIKADQEALINGGEE